MALYYDEILAGNCAGQINIMPPPSSNKTLLKDKKQLLNLTDELGFSIEKLFDMGRQFLKDKQQNKEIQLKYGDNIRLIALSKQIKIGKWNASYTQDVGFLDVVGNDRKQAWITLGDMTKEQAMEEYVKLLLERCPMFQTYIETQHNKTEEDNRLREDDETRRTLEQEAEQLRQRELEQFLRLEKQQKKREDFQRKQIQDVLNQQTYAQFKAYAVQQYRDNPQAQEQLIRQLQDQHFQQYMQQVYQQQLLDQQHQLRIKTNMEQQQQQPENFISSTAQAPLSSTSINLAPSSATNVIPPPAANMVPPPPTNMVSQPPVNMAAAPPPTANMVPPPPPTNMASQPPVNMVLPPSGLVISPPVANSLPSPTIPDNTIVPPPSLNIVHPQVSTNTISSSSPTNVFSPPISTDMGPSSNTNLTSASNIPLQPMSQIQLLAPAPAQLPPLVHPPPMMPFQTSISNNNATQEIKLEPIGSFQTQFETLTLNTPLEPITSAVPQAPVNEDLTQQQQQQYPSGQINNELNTTQELVNGNSIVPPIGEVNAIVNPNGELSLVPEEGKRELPNITPANMWTRKDIKEFKEQIRKEKDAVIKIGSGETVTVRVPTHEDGQCIFWEFATDYYDLGFGLYFEWGKAQSNSVTVHVSDSSDEEENEDGTNPEKKDIEKGSGSTNKPPKPPQDEIVPIYRRDSHEEVYAGSHPYPGHGVYLLKFDNSYSLWRSKTLYYRVYYSK
ncbi:unnamed protein product [Adineta steineri]|uniref:Golgi resident protein GCP60 n=2 Tax=Adineta steineri TaxID=433720 RepID=A0A818QWH5_9BILA|nr:unnamed protein product [Adineta steineri]